MSQIFPSKEKQLILQKIASGIDKVVNFKDFSRPNREIKYFNQLQQLFTTTSKIQDLSKIVHV